MIIYTNILHWIQIRELRVIPSLNRLGKTDGSRIVSCL